MFIYVQLLLYGNGTRTKEMATQWRGLSGVRRYMGVESEIAGVFSHKIVFLCLFEIYNGGYSFNAI